MSILYPGQRVQITNPGVYLHHAGAIVTLVQRTMCENEEGDGGFPVWEVSPVLRGDGFEILWDEQSFTPLDGDELVEGEIPPMDLKFPSTCGETV